MTSNGDLDRLLSDLTRESPVAFARVARIASRLASGEWQTVSDLIAATAISYATTTRIVRRFEPWLEEDQGRIRLLPDAAARVRAALANDEADDPADLFDVLAHERHDEVTRMRRALEALPKPVRHLDHVTATAHTAVKRRLFLSRTYALPHAHLVCLGDHDLTSVAVFAGPRPARTTVVDVDERVLEHVSTTENEIHTLFADLRIALPKSVRETADLVFTDPPYTAEGVRLFLERALESLKRDDDARILFCHGFSERHPAHGLRIEEVLHELRLVPEAVYPAFNRYVGAEAIGSASALYVCRPTRRTWPALARAKPADARIYTRGSGALESATDPLAATIQETVLAGLDAFGPASLLVGAGWSSEDSLHGREIVPLPAYLRRLEEPSARRKRAQAGAGRGQVIAVDLTPYFDSQLARLPLVVHADRLVVVVGSRELAATRLLRDDEPLRRLIGAKYRLGSVDEHDAIAVVSFDLAEPPDDDGVGFVLRYLVDHAHARLRNAWREGLVAWFSRDGGVLTKNEARTALSERSFVAAYGDAYLDELPRHALRAIPDEVEATLAAAAPLARTADHSGG